MNEMCATRQDECNTLWGWGEVSLHTCIITTTCVYSWC